MKLECPLASAACLDESLLCSGPTTSDPEKPWALSRAARHLSLVTCLIALMVTFQTLATAPTLADANVEAIPAYSAAAVQGSTDVDQLVREVVQNEIESQLNEPNLWSYRELTKTRGREVLLEYCQTKYGIIHRLLAVDGHPLDTNQRQAENKRIAKLIRSPETVRAAQKKQSADAQEERRFLKLFPDAFSYQVESQQGDRMSLRFKPAPDFYPSGIEERALRALEGTMIVDAKQKRLVSIRGRLATEVKFWGGLLGHLDQGGTFSVSCESVAPGDWELKSLDVEMNGKVLLFKTIAVQEQDTYSNYTLVPPDTTLAQAAERLENDRGDSPAPESSARVVSPADPQKDF